MARSFENAALGFRIFFDSRREHFRRNLRQERCDAERNFLAAGCKATHFLPGFFLQAEQMHRVCIEALARRRSDYLALAAHEKRYAKLLLELAYVLRNA